MLTATEIDFIITSCAKHQVTKFKLGELEVTFSGFRDQVQEAPTSVTQDLLREMANDKEWMTQSFAPPAEVID